jgi:hypothetical protein
MNKLKQAFTNRSNKSNKSSSTKWTAKATTSLQPQPYHHIPLGSGGVLSRETLGDLQKPATFVGTTATLNTVGIFFEISDSKCFVAHIDAHVTHPSSTEPAQKHYSTNYKTTALLREALIARLDAAMPEGRTKRMRDTILITCARLSGQEPRTADAVVKTVREWLGAEISGGGRVAEARTGFVAGWPAVARVLFEQAPAEGWSAVECRIGAGAWSIGIEEAELEPSDEAW